MAIKCLLLHAGLFATVLVAPAVMAHDMNRSDDMTDVFHAFRLQLDAGNGRNDTVSRYDLDGWVGGDTNKLWVHAVGEQLDGSTQHNETWLLYSRNVDTFWDLQTGVRHDDSPRAVSYAVFGINGLAPYGFETELHLFVSETGDSSVRLHERRDFLLTQHWLLQPYAELDWAAQDVVQQQVGHGLSTGEFGLQLRYEVTRHFAP